jgi:hypothetical protein
MNIVYFFFIANLQLLWLWLVLFPLTLVVIVVDPKPYHIDYHIVKFSWFKCHCNIRTNKFSSEHVLYFNIPGTFSKSMTYIRMDYLGITNRFSNWFSKLGFNFYYMFYKLNYGGWYNWYLFFSNYDKFRMYDLFYHNWYRLILI